MVKWAIGQYLYPTDLVAQQGGRVRLQERTVSAWNAPTVNTLYSAILKHGFMQNLDQNMTKNAY